MSDLCPITLRAAQEFVQKHHRHNEPMSGHKFSIGLMDAGELIGIVTVGQPIARLQCDGYTAEVTRCCVIDGQRNANSQLYAAALRASRAMGYRRVITYTLPEESGASLRAVGFRRDSMTRHNKSGWNMPGRPRRTPERYPVGPKVRWVKTWASHI